MFHKYFSPLDLGLLVGAVVSLPFYVFVLFVIWRNRDEHPFKDSSFFRISLVLGLVDCAQLLWVYFFYKMPAFGLFSVGSSTRILVLYSDNASGLPQIRGSSKQ